VGKKLSGRAPLSVNIDETLTPPEFNV
jgi:hypothetical protein